jgi:hypothetical protein
MNTLAHALKRNVTSALAPVRIPPARSFEVSPSAPSASMNASHQYNQLAVNNPSLSVQSCPLSIANPRACPTGGACHLCPGKS